MVSSDLPRPSTLVMRETVPDTRIACESHFFFAVISFFFQSDQISPSEAGFGSASMRKSPLSTSPVPSSTPLMEDIAPSIDSQPASNPASASPTTSFPVFILFFSRSASPVG
ncbi:hypothetical protein D3C72_1827800 [compost metagenome]